MEKTCTLGQAVTDFEDKFRRFRMGGGKEADPMGKAARPSSEADPLPESERHKKSVIETYKKFISPFQVFGRNSAIADQLERDKESLVAAYNLHKGLQELNGQYGSEDSYIKSAVIETPLTRRERYTEGGEFIYLQCWFMYEHRPEFVPQLERPEKGRGWVLSFVPPSRRRATGSDLEVEAVIQECFYPGQG